jgi:hypothetical protein
VERQYHQSEADRDPADKRPPPRLHCVAPQRPNSKFGWRSWLPRLKAGMAVAPLAPALLPATKLWATLD